VIEAGGDVSRAALLAALEDERADPAARCFLGLELIVDITLYAIETQGQDCALFGADAQMLARKMFEIGIGKRRASLRLRFSRLHLLFEPLLQARQVGGRDLINPVWRFHLVCLPPALQRR